MNIIHQHNQPKPKLIGLILLFIAFAISIPLIIRGTFVDEADNLVLGSLMAENYTLYQDLFSHHFPFPYHWMQIVVEITGKNLFIARFSVLIFQLIAFAITMRLTRSYTPIGITAIFWAIIRIHYFGNMVLYNSFVAPSLFLIAAVTLAILQGKTKPSHIHWVALGLFSAISILSDPLSVYPIGTAFAFLFVKNPRWGIYPALICTLPLTIYFATLWLTGPFDAFWEHAMLFNTEIYSEYKSTTPIQFDRWGEVIYSGLEIHLHWWRNADPLRPIKGFIEFDQWLFTGFLYRLSIIVLAITLLLKRQLLAPIFIYLFAAGTLIVTMWNFHIQAFVLIALFVISFILFDKSIRKDRHASCQTNKNNQAASSLLSNLTLFWQIVTRLIVGLMVLWLMGRLVTDLYVNRHIFTPQEQLGWLQDESQKILNLSCHQPNVRLARYSSGTYFHWFTDYPPLSKYVFMWPWVTDSGALEDDLAILQQEETLAIVILDHAVIWAHYDSRDYLRPLEEYVQANYVSPSENVYISPALHRACQSGQQ